MHIPSIVSDSERGNKFSTKNCSGHEGLLVRLHTKRTCYKVQNTSVIVPFGGSKLSLRTSVEFVFLLIF